MIHGTDWTAERAARAVRLMPPPGFRILTQLEVLQVGDLQGWCDGTWKPLHEANIGREARGVASAARTGQGGQTEDWMELVRPGDYIQLSAIDRQAIEAVAAGAQLDQLVPLSFFWQCMTCGATYRKGAEHSCGWVDA